MVLDLATGTGDFCRGLERRGMVAMGLDLSMGMLTAARTSAPLVHADILSMLLQFKTDNTDNGRGLD